MDCTGTGDKTDHGHQGFGAAGFQLSRGFPGELELIHRKKARNVHVTNKNEITVRN